MLGCGAFCVGIRCDPSARGDFLAGAAAAAVTHRLLCNASRPCIQSVRPQTGDHVVSHATFRMHRKASRLVASLTHGVSVPLLAMGSTDAM